MEGLLLQAVATDRMRDRRRRARDARRAAGVRRSTKRPAGSWVLSNSVATWLGR